MNRERITQLITNKVVNTYIRGPIFGDSSSCQTMTYPDGTFLVISTKVNTLSYTAVGDILDSVSDAIKGEGLSAECCDLSCVSIGYGMTISFRLRKLKD